MLMFSSGNAIFHYPELFYEMSVSNFEKTATAAVVEPQQIHLLRIPKASSSALSQVARRAVGCYPPGPCCKYPGDPPGTCPSKQLFSCQLTNRVIGCTSHNANYPALLNNSIPSWTMIREPISRALSAFFYPGIHHNSACHNDIHHCFRQYCTDNRWKNIVTKMLTGANAYTNIETCLTIDQCPNSVELAIHNLKYISFIGVAECWELSLLLLHSKFPYFKPSKEEFELFSPNLQVGNGKKQ